MKLTLAIFLSIIAVAANAAEPFVFERDGRWWQIPMPEYYWFSEPLLAPMSVERMSGRETTRFCTAVTGKYEDSACALITPRECRIVLSNDLSPLEYAKMLYHEEAHCHGWPADHPTD